MLPSTSVLQEELDYRERLHNIDGQTSTASIALFNLEYINICYYRTSVALEENLMASVHKRD